LGDRLALICTTMSLHWIKTFPELSVFMSVTMNWLRVSKKIFEIWSSQENCLLKFRLLPRTTDWSKSYSKTIPVNLLFMGMSFFAKLLSSLQMVLPSFGAIFSLKPPTLISKFTFSSNFLRKNLFGEKIRFGFLGRRVDLV
jgi:hypothetical protein